MLQTCIFEAARNYFYGSDTAEAIMTKAVQYGVRGDNKTFLITKSKDASAGDVEYARQPSRSWKECRQAQDRSWGFR
ncbi:MAG TPA: hypothetical protein VM103_00565 [Candidatus Paceibacterota bacterium]|nr:hypothetical protein [Candidatus Paceibacterota bacterium]